MNRTKTHLRCILDAHTLHALLQRLGWSSALKLAQGDAAVLVGRCHLFPLLDLGNARLPDGLCGILNGLARAHITELNKGHWNQARAAKSTNRFGNKPLWVGLGNDDDGLSCLGLELVGSLCVEVVHYHAINHGTLLASRLGHALRCGRRRCAAGGVDFAIARIMVWVLVCSRWAATIRLLAVPLSLAQRLEKGYGHETPRIRQRRIASLVPVRIVLAADDVEKIAFGEAQLLGRAGLVVVESSNNLRTK